MNEVMLKLKEATHADHVLTEKYAYAAELKSGNFTPLMYHDLLLKNLYIHSKIDQRLLNSDLFKNSSFNGFYVSKIALLKKDLQKFHPNFFSFETELKIELVDPAQLLGLLYVVEGSMLGGQYIHNLLMKNKNFNSLRPFHFFNGLGKEIKQHWLKFAALSKKVITNKPLQESAIETSIETFTFFRKVYQEKSKPIDFMLK